MTILCDIGGTYARFAPEGQLAKNIKYTVADYESFESALAAFCKDSALPQGGALRIATAAYPDGPVWRFVNRNKWVIDAATLARQGWNVELIINDFAAATWGLMTLGENDQQILKAGSPDQSLPKALIGPGTGLGLGFLIPTDKGFHVQRTHGGHMIVAGMTNEHHAIINAVQKIKGDDTIPVFENFVSGLGLMNIYKAVCAIENKKPEAEKPEDLFEAVSTPQTATTLRVFHEFFGLFAQTITVTGHAYGGLYLTGGVLDRLIARDLFDFEGFKRFFILRGVDSVNKALDNTPAIWVKDNTLTFKGLLNAHA